MDINDLRGLSTAFLMVTFLGLCIWAYSSKRKKTFDDAANLPFADEELNQRTMQEQHQEEARND
jgi:cytochrome c oxidase cbb3-type subunit 4